MDEQISRILQCPRDVDEVAEATRRGAPGAFDLLPSPVVLLDGAGVIREVNAAWCRDAGLGGAVTAGGVGWRYELVLRGAGATEVVEMVRAATRVPQRGVFAWHDDAQERWVAVDATPCAGDRVVVEHRDVTGAQQRARREGIAERLRASPPLERSPEALRWLCAAMGWCAAAVWRADPDGALAAASVALPTREVARPWGALRAHDLIAAEAFRAGAGRWSTAMHRVERALLREALRERARDVVAALAVPSATGAVTFYAPHRRRPEADFEAMLAAHLGGLRAPPVDAPSGEGATLRGRVALAAMTPAPVLLTGEDHCGKSSLAAEIHRRGERASGPLVRVACDDPAVIARLVGEARREGDAREFTPGALDRARGGTLVLDRVDALDAAAQGILRDLLTRGRYRRAGAAEERCLDARVIACSRLPAEALRGRLDDALVDRLAVLCIAVPPLRERAAELPELARELLAEVAQAWSRPPPALSDDAVRALLAHAWPGNLRELRAVLERAWMGVGATITAASIAAARATSEVVPGAAVSVAAEGAPADDAGLAALERAHVERVLRQSRGRVAAAARVLGISRSTLYERMRAWEMDLDALRAAG